MKRLLAILLMTTMLLPGLCGLAEGEAPMSLYARYLTDGSVPSLCEAYADYFPIGTCLSRSQLGDAAAMAIVSRHFNSVTCENEMKADSVMNQAATRAAGDPERISLNFGSADPILRWARDNGLKVRAHTLVWYSQVPRWAFTVDYTAGGELCGRETMIRRMENYIHDYMTYVNETYPGLVYAWDVVNEAIEPGDRHPQGLRTGKNLWYQVIGEDYIELAFTFARQWQAEGQQLFYNDYGCYNITKQVYIRALLKDLQDKGLVDGIGMQSHIDMDTPGPLDYEKAVTLFLDMGLTVQATELDVRTEDASLSGQMRLAARYKSLFGMFRRLKGMAKKDIGGVTFWGFTDRHTWLTSLRGVCYPLLFDAEYGCKPAFFGAMMDTSIPLSLTDDAINGAIAALGLEEDSHFVPENPDIKQIFDEAAASGEGLYSYPDAQAAWYQQLLASSQLSLGSNLRLKEALGRCRAGEDITLAVIGGSITEGAGAARYSECWASQLAAGLRVLAGPEAGNIALVNAGVGGTPSTFGWLRWQRDVVNRVTDADGLPDIVVIEFAVNDGGEPTGHRCYESMVRHILAQPNHPAVILLFAVFQTGYTLQDEIRAVGDACDLMMVSLRDSAFPHVGKEWTAADFFYDEYHPTSMGHGVMADCILSAIRAADAAPASDADSDPATPPAYGTDYLNLVSIFGDSDPAPYGLTRGSFSRDDTGSYTNHPVGRVCGPNFSHNPAEGNEPLRFNGRMKNLLIAYRTVSDASFGQAEVLVDGQVRRTLKANTGSWGQSVVDLIFADSEAAEHTVEIRMADGNEGKKFTVTAIGFAE